MIDDNDDVDGDVLFTLIDAGYQHVPLSQILSEASADSGCVDLEVLQSHGEALENVCSVGPEADGEKTFKWNEQYALTWAVAKVRARAAPAITAMMRVQQHASATTLSCATREDVNTAMQTQAVASALRGMSEVVAGSAAKAATFSSGSNITCSDGTRHAALRLSHISEAVFANREQRTGCDAHWRSWGSI